MRQPSYGLRTRLMIIGVVGVGAGLVFAGLAFYGALTFSVNRTLDNEALAGAGDVAVMVNEDRLPNPVPVSGAQVIQVVDAQSRVVGGSVTADRLTPLLTAEELQRAVAGDAIVVDGVRLGIDEPFRVRAVSAGPAADPVSVIAAVPVGDVLEARRALRGALLITLPLLLAVLAAIAWRVIGSTLRPVEALRAGAEQISRTTPERGPRPSAAPGERTDRLPVPAAADEIQALALTLNGMLDRLAEARERQRAFVADAAHELRSPLASMRAQLEVAARLGEGGELPADLLIDVERLTALVDDLLLLARSDADARGPVVSQQVDVGALLLEVAAAYPPGPPAVRVSAAEPVIATADPAELRRVMDNLTGNAVRHARSQVQLSAAADQGVVRISVSDDGPGIAPADRELVFRRFARLDDARARDVGGTGLGLAIVRELVTRAGGTVTINDAEPPLTLRVEVQLPAPEARELHAR